MLEKLTREEIRQSIYYVVSSAFEEKNKGRLEDLPYSGDYDSAVHEYAKELAQNFDDKDYYDVLVNELVEHYYINQEDYDF